MSSFPHVSINQWAQTFQSLEAEKAIFSAGLDWMNLRKCVLRVAVR